MHVSVSACLYEFVYVHACVRERVSRCAHARPSEHSSGMSKRPEAPDCQPRKARRQVSPAEIPGLESCHVESSIRQSNLSH